MSATEYKKLRNAIIVAFIPIFAAVAYGAAGMHFGMKNKVEYTQYQEGLYSVQLLVEKKTAILEQMVVGDRKDNEHLYDEIERINNRIDELYRQLNRVRSTNTQ